MPSNGKSSGPSQVVRWRWRWRFNICSEDKVDIPTPLHTEWPCRLDWSWEKWSLDMETTTKGMTV